MSEPLGRVQFNQDNVVVAGVSERSIEMVRGHLNAVVEQVNQMTQQRAVEQQRQIDQALRERQNRDAADQATTDRLRSILDDDAI